MVNVATRLLFEPCAVIYLASVRIFLRREIVDLLTPKSLPISAAVLPIDSRESASARSLALSFLGRPLLTPIDLGRSSMARLSRSANPARSR